VSLVVDRYDRNLVEQAVGYTIGHGLKQSEFNFEDESCSFDWYAQLQLYAVATTLGELLDTELRHIKVKVETLLCHVKSTVCLSEDQHITI